MRESNRDKLLHERPSVDKETKSKGKGIIIRHRIVRKESHNE